MYTLRSATDADYDFLYQLFVATMRPSITQVWGWEEARWATFFRQIRIGQEFAGSGHVYAQQLGLRRVVQEKAAYPLQCSWRVGHLAE